jgi:hypothetical protein
MRIFTLATVIILASNIAAAQSSPQVEKYAGEKASVIVQGFREI